MRLDSTQIKHASKIYHEWQEEGTDGTRYAYPELYCSVFEDEIKNQGWSLVPSKYIEFIDHDMDINYHDEMARIQDEMKALVIDEKQSQKMLEDAFRGIGYDID